MWMCINRYVTILGIVYVFLLAIEEYFGKAIPKVLKGVGSFLFLELWEGDMVCSHKL